MRATLPVLAALLVTAVPAAADPQDDRLRVRSAEVVSGPSPYDACRGTGMEGVEASPQLLPGGPGDAPFVVWQQDALHGGGPDVDTDAPGLGSTAGDVGVGACGTAGKEGDLLLAPSVALGPDGSRWVAATALGPERSAVVLSRQQPGLAWEEPRTVMSFPTSLPQLSLLAPTVAVDPDNPLTVHVAYSRNHFPAGTIAVHKVSTDGGKSWSDEHTMGIGPTPIGYDFAEQLVALGDGQLLAVSTEIDQVGMATLAPDYAAYGDLSQAPIVHRARTFDDETEMWSDPVEVMKLANGGVRDRERGGTALRSLVRPSVLLGDDGRVHVAAESVAADGEETQLFVATSEDRGVTWIPYLAATVEGVAFAAAVAADGTGRLGLSWLDLSGDGAGDDTLDAEWRFASSRDGRAWSPSQAISPTFDLRPMAPVYVGDQGALLGLRKGFAAATVVGTGTSSQEKNPSDVVLTTLR